MIVILLNFYFIYRKQSFDYLYKKIFFFSFTLKFYYFFNNKMYELIK